LRKVKPNALVLAVGNFLLQDEGLGVRALERLLDSYVLPPEVEAIDGGTMGLDLLPYFVGLTDLLLIDAVETGQEPGTIVRLEGDAIPAALALKMSVHQVGLQEVLATSKLQGTAPSRIVLWGMQPASFEWELRLSPIVEARIGALVDAVVGELCSWGLDIHNKMLW
jgi:hydrogenase maturation protease